MVVEHSGFALRRPHKQLAGFSHPMGPKMQARMTERGLYDPKQAFPQTNAQAVICYRECFDLDYAMPRQREGGVTLSLITSGGEVDWIARDLLQVSTGEALNS
jgi:hypothetical protein